LVAGLVTILACWGALIIGAVYMLRAVRAMLHGPLPEQWGKVTDAPHLWRKAPFILLLAALIIFGCFPRLLTDKIEPSVREKVIAAVAPEAPPGTLVTTRAFLNTAPVAQAEPIPPAVAAKAGGHPN